MRAHQRIHVQSQAGTARVAVRLAHAVRGGAVIALSGPLGAGKTTFVKVFAKALGIRQTVTSPTFLLMRVYSVPSSAKASAGRQGSAFPPPLKLRRAGRVQRLVHVDAYRVQSAHELVGIGLLDFMEQPDTVTLVEWAEKVKAILPKRGVQWVRIQFGKGPNEREIVLSE